TSSTHELIHYQANRMYQCPVSRLHFGRRLTRSGEYEVCRCSERSPGACDGDPRRSWPCSVHCANHILAPAACADTDEYVTWPDQGANLAREDLSKFVVVAHRR